MSKVPRYSLYVEHGEPPELMLDKAGDWISFVDYEELESKLDAAEDRCHFYDPSGTDDDGQCCKTCGTGALAHDPKVLEVSARILGRIAHLESERDPYRNLLDIETRDARIKDLESRLDSIRQAIIDECYREIDKHIKRGELQGNGCDDTAQRNGMVLACNILHGFAKKPVVEKQEKNS
jgi:hypothetical protein